MKTELLMILLSWGVLASIVTSIINLVSIRNTNKRLFQILKLENDNSIRTFRYTKLFELNVELNNLPDMNYTMLEEKNGKLVLSNSKIVEVTEKVTARFHMFVKIFYKARPLFDESIISEVQELLKK